MQNTNHHRQQTSPPNLLRGILTAVLGITISILALSWFIIDFHFEQLVIKRTSEYAHSIARIAADSSAEALLADDKLQLNLLVQNVAKDPYIRQATIISEEGQIVTQYPEETIPAGSVTGTENISVISIVPSGSSDQHPLTREEQTSKNEQKDRTVTMQKPNQQSQPPFVLRQKNKTFFEPITYQNIAAGWFKLEIDKFQLEQDFRDIFIEIQWMIVIISLVLLMLLLFIVYRFEKSIKQLVLSCQHLLLQKGLKPSSNKSNWLESVKELSQSHQQRLHEHVSLPKQTDNWLHSKIVSNALVCYLEFNILSQENSHIAGNLTQAESFLNKSIQAFGVQSQGDILSGCLIPFDTTGFDNTEAGSNKIENPSGNNHSLTEALGLIYLINKLFTRLNGNIQVKAFIMRAPVLLLEDEQDVTTGVSLIGRSLDKINQLSLLTHFNEIVSLSIPAADFENKAQIEAIITDGLEDKNSFRLLETSPAIQQQIARKYKYISTSQIDP